MGVVGFMWGRCVHSVSRWWSFGSSEVVVFFRGLWVHSEGLWVHAVSLCSLGFALGSLGSSGVVGSLRFALGFVGFILSRGVHLCSHWGCLDSSGVVGFNRVALGVVRFIRGSWVHSDSPLGSSEGVGFILVRSVDRWVLPASSCSFGFALGFAVFIWGRWILSDSRWGSLGSLGFALGSGLVGIMRVCGVPSGSRLGSLCSFGVIEFTPVRAGGHLESWGTIGLVLRVVAFIRGH